jgi:Pilin (bacterial filament)
MFLAQSHLTHNASRSACGAEKIIMKQFVLTAAGCLIGVLIALFVYDSFIVQPRELALQQKETSAALERARAEGRDITKNIDASVQKSVAEAKAAFDAQAKEMSDRSSMGNAIGRSSMFKVAITEYYQSEGKLPKDNAAIGFAKPEEYAAGMVSAIAVGDLGVVTVSFNDKLDANAKIKLTPVTNAKTTQINWRCETVGSAVLTATLRGCNGEMK